MKYFAFIIVLAAGCSHPSSPEAKGPQSAQFQPGGIHYMAPGIFKGFWTTDYYDSNDFEISHTIDSCVTTITESDSLLRGTIVNNFTGEVLTLRGSITSPTDGVFSPHLYAVMSQSNDGDSSYTELTFYVAGDTLSYSDWYPLPHNVSFVDWINGMRQK